MLFNSYGFILVFLPVSLAAYHALRQLRLDRAAIGFLALASLVFYAWWNVLYLLLLLALVVGNFIAVRMLIALPRGQCALRRTVAAVAITGNLTVLGYFKYAIFVADNLGSLLGYDLALQSILLPLGISFFTFQKIALVVDAYQGKVQQLRLLDYLLFVSFFPQLIAGPIVHHSEIIPQFAQRGRVSANLFASALTMFIIGLGKKVLLADHLAEFATPPFNAVAAGAAPSALLGWSAALAYTLQLYFDFSGYSDMAIGTALMFGIRLPINFASPYKADSIIAFWRQWHVTLSRFLRSYLYIPLGGNRHGRFRQHSSLLLTMVLGGFWHGAAWTFVVWGTLQGLFLVTNHGWRAFRNRAGGILKQRNATARLLGHLLTFVAVVVGWVFFRADSLPAAIGMLRAMAGVNGLTMVGGNRDWSPDLFLLVPCLGLVLLGPNTQELAGYVPGFSHDDRMDERSYPEVAGFRCSVSLAVAYGGLFAAALLSLSKVSEFLYFQF